MDNQIIERLIKLEEKSKDVVILKPGTRTFFLKPDEVKKLNHYKFSLYFQKTGFGILKPILKYYYVMKNDLPEISYSQYHLLQLSKDTVSLAGVIDHLKNWEDKASEQPPNVDDLIELFSKALVEEARARGIFDEIDKVVEAEAK